ncbi:MAG TPA: alanine--tRNA ligase [bacterium]|nr:alanine--tRNA ligase [bacterium]
MTASDIRQSFLDFFTKQNHRIVPSAPVVPPDDPTLLFTNAGMNQFKDVFLGTGTRPYSRAADSQKCIRVSGKHNDLEAVGYDTYHHTFFEMLGNWSFGDYYKAEAIGWAWELLTREWGLPKDRLWATVFREDDEAEALWKKGTDITPSRILRFDEKDNFWEMGATGPCGPCSEIHIDLGEGFCDKHTVPGHVCGVNAGCGRFIELWNIVFIQHNRDDKGGLHPLPSKHVDTGMGFERITAVLQGKTSNYDTDIFMPLQSAIENLTGKSGRDEALAASFRVIADHVRAVSFAVTDGAIPSNEGRGYVLRRLLRRAARYGRNLGMEEPFIYKLVPTLVGTMGAAYPELNERARHTTHVIQSEEERFNEVLDRGIEIFEKLVADALSRRQKQIAGADAFRLYDTYGFPLDLTQLMAREKGLTVDEAGFEREMEAQRTRARESHQFAHSGGDWQTVSEGADSAFLGYERLSMKTEIRKFRKDKDAVTLLLAETPFYAESGGQVGDTGEIVGADFHIRVDETRKQGDQILHAGRFLSGSEISSPAVEARVTTSERLSTARNHTATHLLHKALRKVLGDHVNQAGSLVAPDRFRFDFTHYEALKPDEIRAVEAEVNTHIRINHPVNKFVTSLADARKRGATALFGETYGETVRVVQIDTYSMELCGGTHLDATGEIGYFRIVAEESVASGVRRIEAVTGEGADRLLESDRETLRTVQALLRCGPDEITSRLRSLIDERKSLEKEIRKTRQASSASEVDPLLADVRTVSGIRFVAAEVSVPDVESLRMLGDKLREKLKSGVGVLGMISGDKVNILAVVTDDLIREKSLKAGEIVKAAAAAVGGSGGGKPHLALAGGKEVSKLQDALGLVPSLLARFIDRPQAR